MSLLDEIAHGVIEHQEQKRDEAFDQGYAKAKSETHAEIAELKDRIEHLRGERDKAEEKMRVDAKAEVAASLGEIREHIRAIHGILKDRFGV